VNRIETENRVVWSALGAVAGAGAIAASLAIFKKKPFQFGWLTVGAVAGGAITAAVTTDRVENGGKKKGGHENKAPYTLDREFEVDGKTVHLAVKERPDHTRPLVLIEKGTDVEIAIDRLKNVRDTIAPIVQAVDSDLPISDVQARNAGWTIYQIEQLQAHVHGSRRLEEPEDLKGSQIVANLGVYYLDEGDVVFEYDGATDDQRWTPEEFRAYMLEDANRLTQLGGLWALWVLRFDPEPQIDLEQARVAYKIWDERTGELADPYKEQMLRRLSQIHPEVVQKNN